MYQEGLFDTHRYRYHKRILQNTTKYCIILYLWGKTDPIFGGNLTQARMIPLRRDEAELSQGATASGTCHASCRPVSDFLQRGQECGAEGVEQRARGVLVALIRSTQLV